MGHYNFWEDLEIAKRTEIEIAKAMHKQYGVEILGDMSDTNKWDFRLRLKNQSTISIEVKEDFLAHKTGNTVVEFSSRGKPSGVSTSKANFFLYRIRAKDENKHVHFLFHTARLKWLMRNHKHKLIVTGGDDGSETKMALFSLDVLLPYGKELFL